MFKGLKSNRKDIIGGGPQGTLLGGLEYIVSNDDCCKEEIEAEDRFKYYDDLNLLEFIVLSDQLVQYDVRNHIPSDIGIDDLFLPPETYQMQKNFNYISYLTEDILMLLNEKKFL